MKVRRGVPEKTADRKTVGIRTAESTSDAPAGRTNLFLRLFRNDGKSPIAAPESTAVKANAANGCEGAPTFEAWRKSWISDTASIFCANRWSGCPRALTAPGASTSTASSCRLGEISIGRENSQPTPAPAAAPSIKGPLQGYSCTNEHGPEWIFFRIFCLTGV
jgi:hypothetical protein